MSLMSSFAVSGQITLPQKFGQTTNGHLLTTVFVGYVNCQPAEQSTTHHSSYGECIMAVLQASIDTIRLCPQSWGMSLITPATDHSCLRRHRGSMWDMAGKRNPVLWSTSGPYRIAYRIGIRRRTPAVQPQGERSSLYP